jgi:hypothetical protein
MDNLFEKATRNAVRFEYKGLLSVEDLWNLTARELDTIFKTLNAKAKVQKEESLLDTRSTEETLTDLKIEIVKYIFSVKMQEKNEREAAAERKAKKERLLEVLAQKQDAALLNASEEELMKQLAELE